MWKYLRFFSITGLLVLAAWGTALGGQLGIHGLGVGDAEIHRAYNWTRGCVALEDWQIDELRPWLRVGMPVEIR